MNTNSSGATQNRPTMSLLQGTIRWESRRPPTTVLPLDDSESVETDESLSELDSGTESSPEAIASRVAKRHRGNPLDFNWPILSHDYLVQSDMELDQIIEDRQIRNNRQDHLGEQLRCDEVLDGFDSDFENEKGETTDYSEENCSYHCGSTSASSYSCSGTPSPDKHSEFFSEASPDSVNSSQDSPGRNRFITIPTLEQVDEVQRQKGRALRLFTLMKARLFRGSTLSDEQKAALQCVDLSFNRSRQNLPKITHDESQVTISLPSHTVIGASKDKMKDMMLHAIARSLHPKDSRPSSHRKLAEKIGFKTYKGSFAKKTVRVYCECNDKQETRFYKLPSTENLLKRKCTKCRRVFCDRVNAGSD